MSMRKLGIGYRDNNIVKMWASLDEIVSFTTFPVSVVRGWIDLSNATRERLKTKFVNGELLYYVPDTWKLIEDHARHIWKTGRKTPGDDGPKIA